MSMPCISSLGNVRNINGLCVNSQRTTAHTKRFRAVVFCFLIAAVGDIAPQHAPPAVASESRSNDGLSLGCSGSRGAVRGGHKSAATRAPGLASRGPAIAVGRVLSLYGFQTTLPVSPGCRAPSLSRQSKITSRGSDSFLAMPRTMRSASLAATPWMENPRLPSGV